MKSNTKNFFAASLLFFITTTYTTSTTILRSALYNDALRRVVAVAIRRARRVRRGEINLKQRSCEKHQYYFLSLVATGGIKNPFQSVQSVSSVFNPVAFSKKRRSLKCLNRRAVVVVNNRQQSYSTA